MSAKHRRARYWIEKKIFDRLSSFAVLEQRINLIPEEKDRGDVFEIFVEGFLATQRVHQYVVHWVVGDIPLRLREKYNLPSDAKGIDGVYKNRLGTYVAYQVKYRQKDSLTFTEVAPFLGVTERFDERVIFTNARELAKDAKARKGMRLVRGDDFRALTPEDLARLEAWLKHQPPPRPLRQPKPYQTEALDDIKACLRTADRATVVMACGTGKTLVALWATQALKPKTVLVLVPSLTLLQQTLGEWTKHNTFTPGFRYLCVCSDQTVGLKNDEIELRPSDVEFRIDTDPAEVRRFLVHRTNDVKVIFSTYQSSPVVAQGAKGKHFDVGIFDEAHKTTGRAGTGFTFALDEHNVAIKKRVFFTATSRIYDIRHRNKDGDVRIQSMDDPTFYGPRAHTLSFKRAADGKIICPYKVIVSLIDKQMVTDFARKYGITLIETDEVHARWVANVLAFKQAIENTRATKAITFHSRVKTAEAFASPTTQGITQYLRHYEVWHVNGKQPSSERTAIINAFRDSSKGVLTNARCLTEGIDVPAVDLVAFLDPKESRIDIAQATGRAMRKPQDTSTKTVGYVVVPLFAEALTKPKLQEAIESEGFDVVADVLNALQEQDEDLVDIIRELRERKGEGKPVDLRRLRKKLEVIGPTVDLVRLTTSISVALVDRIGISWDEWYGRLVKYKKREGNCLVPALHNDNGYPLGQWVSKQRVAKKKNLLAPDRIKRLDDLGFMWDPHKADWEEGYAHLVTYKKREGHCLVPQDYKEDGYPLGQWVSKQRIAKKKNLLAPDRIERLDALGFVWDPLAAAWEEGYAHLVKYKERKKDCLVPLRYKADDGYLLGQWVYRQRIAKKKNLLAPDRIERLDDLGFVWKLRQSRKR